MIDQATPDPPDLIKPGEAAAILDISVSTFARIVRRGEIAFYPIGSRRKFKRSEVIAYVEAQRRTESGPSTNLPGAGPAPVKIPPLPTTSGLLQPGRKSFNPFSERLTGGK